MKAIVVVLLVAVLAESRISAAQFPVGAQAATVDAATVVLNEVMHLPAKRIPQRLLFNAHGIAIIPNVVKGGFVVGIRHGKGVVMVRDETGAWQPPQFISLTGGSVGFQAGVQATDVVLVFKTPKSIQGLLQGKFTIGGDAAAAAGPVGRQASAATDGQLRAEIYSYSRSRGLFAGVSLDGSVIEVDHLANNAYYSRHPGGLPPSASRLLNHVASYASASDAGQPQAWVAKATGPAATNLPAATGSIRSVSSPAGVQKTDQLRMRLAGAAGQLQSLLDESWRAYLALPAGVYSSTDPPEIESLSAAQSRYQAVATNPSYASLSRRNEFQAVHQLLQQYMSSLTAQASQTIQLPPPPAVGVELNHAQKRY